MQVIPPRVTQLLKILAAAKTPVSVANLAKQCGVSRRTIFREIEHIDLIIKPYALCVGTKIGEGVYLKGDNSNIKRLQELLEELEQKNSVQPTGRNERHILLTLDLLTCGETQKLYYYANNFHVSEATISHDFDLLEEKLHKFHITIIRKPSHGVTIKAKESSVRHAICAALLEAAQNNMSFHTTLNYPSSDITSSVRQLMETRFENQVVWLTAESKEALIIYLAVAAERIISHNIAEEPTAEVPPHFLSIADFLSNSIQIKFSILLSEWERKQLAIYLSALRQSSNIGQKSSQALNDYLLKRLTYQMIEYFDKELSPFLKLDDRLIEGLTLHIQSAMVRIQNHVELIDPLYEEIANTYPDVLKKSKRALKALHEFSNDIPESEASFLATHFGAAIMRIQEHTIRRLRIAVVCSGGIGTSYLLVSQIKKHFSANADFEICSLFDVDDWKRFDLCVTSMPLPNIEIPVLSVSLILEEQDVEAIRSFISSMTASEKHISVGNVPLLERCEHAKAMMDDVQTILTYFDTMTIESDCDFDRLAKLTGYRFGGTEESGRLIYDDLIKRESMSTQVIPRLELILLHAKTSGVKSPVFSLILPEDERFISPMLKNSRCCVVMLVPFHASRDMLNLMGRISVALMEDDDFLSAVLRGDKVNVYALLEKNFRDYLVNNIIF